MLFAAAAAKSLQSCPTVRPQRQQPTRLPRPWDSPGENTGVGCHFLLQCMKVKSESEVTQSCPTLSDPMDCTLPGSSVHGIFQARVLEWGAIALLFCLFIECIFSFCFKVGGWGRACKLLFGKITVVFFFLSPCPCFTLVLVTLGLSQF